METSILNDEELVNFVKDKIVSCFRNKDDECHGSTDDTTCSIRINRTTVRNYRKRGRLVEVLKHAKEFGWVPPESCVRNSYNSTGETKGSICTFSSSRLTMPYEFIDSLIRDTSKPTTSCTVATSPEDKTKLFKIFSVWKVMLSHLADKASEAAHRKVIKRRVSSSPMKFHQYLIILLQKMLRTDFATAMHMDLGTPTDTLKLSLGQTLKDDRVQGMPKTCLGKRKAAHEGKKENSELWMVVLFLSLCRLGCQSSEQVAPQPSLTIEPPSLTIEPPSLTIEPPSLTIEPPSLTIETPSLMIEPPSLIIEPPGEGFDSPWPVDGEDVEDFSFMHDLDLENMEYDNALHNVGNTEYYNALDIETTEYYDVFDNKRQRQLDECLLDDLDFN